MSALTADDLPRATLIRLDGRPQIWRAYGCVELDGTRVVVSKCTDDGRRIDERTQLVAIERISLVDGGPR
jgi:hypothetical protein